jgi:tartrate dehydratase beta subunit/fumarate hydratase class I family protein
VAFPDLGPEAIWQLDVSDFPMVVAADSRGKTIY